MDDPKQSEMNLIPMTERRQRDIKLFRQFLDHRAVTMEMPVRWADGYHVRITKINDDGTFEGVLLDVVPCM